MNSLCTAVLLDRGRNEGVDTGCMMGIRLFTVARAYFRKVESSDVNNGRENHNECQRAMIIALSSQLREKTSPALNFFIPFVIVRISVIKYVDKSNTIWFVGGS